jgi:predicted enzyme related to lactoylglutathione lyase
VHHVALHLHCVTFDAADPLALANFWAALTGYEVAHSNEFVAGLTGNGTAGPRYLFIKVPEGKVAKNRMHLDLGTADLDAEVERVLALGAILVGRYDEWGVQWAAFTDPEGNVFCVGLHPPASDH